MCEQIPSYLVKDSKLGVKKFNKIFHKNCTKSSKMASTPRRFSKNFGIAFPRTPLELFLFLDLPQSNSVGKKCQNVVPFHPPEKNLNTPLTQNIFKELIFTPFSGSKRLTSLHLVTIQPNLKPHPPPKVSGSAPGDERSKFSIVNRSFQ